MIQTKRKGAGADRISEGERACHRTDSGDRKEEREEEPTASL